MAKPTIKLNSREIARMLRSTEVLAELTARGNRVAAAAGPGFEAKPSVGRNRARVAVVATTLAAQRAEARSAVLTRALEAGRG